MATFGAQPRHYADREFPPDLALARSSQERPLRGHEDQFLPLRLSARSVIRKQTVAATRGNGRDAPMD